MTTADDSIRDRIRKLLALSQSPNEHEAASAAAKAQELLTQHQLTREDVTETEFAYLDVFLSLAPGELTWHIAVALAVAKPNGCTVLQGDLPGTHLLRFVGEHDVLDTVVAFYHDLLPIFRAVVEQEWQSYVQEYTDPLYGVYPGVLDTEGSWRQSFLYGMAARLHERLLETRREVAEHYSEDRSSALIRLDKQDAAVQEYVRGHFKTKDVTPDGQTLDVDGLTRGIGRGATLPLGTQRRLPG
jgi:hypothetical protein